LRNQQPLIELRDVWFRYKDGEWILRGVKESFYEGETVLIIGEAGSGKTTLARAVTGLGETLYGGELKGEIVYRGRDIKELDFSELFKEIRVVGQNPYNYFIEPLLREDLMSHIRYLADDEKKAEKIFNKIIDMTRLRNLINRYFYELSGGEARRALIAKALASDPVLIIFDEPLMWLDDDSTKDFLMNIVFLKELRKTLIILEHRFKPLINISDRVLLLRDGVLKDVTSKIKSISREKMSKEDPVVTKRSFDNKIILKTIGLWHRYDHNIILRNINLSVDKGDVVMIYGPNGSGKTTLLKILAGYLKPWRGRIYRDADMMYIPQNISLFYTEESVKKEVQEICKTRRLGERCTKDLLKKIIDRGIDVNLSPFDLSYGQQVKLAIEISRNISDNIILLIDEPFSGLTYVDRIEILKDLLTDDKTKIIATANLDIISRYRSHTKIYMLREGSLYKYIHSEADENIDLEFLKSLYRGSL